ncbi:MAG: hypothetical protein JNM30_16990, partial [Rhodospirillales bacterium]|nr:hypothetical protein [Rhodospirillales bacterium]
MKSVPRPVALVAAIVGALVVLILAMTAYEADREYRVAIAGAERETYNAQQLLVEHAARTVETVTRALEAAAELHASADGDAGRSDAAIHEMLKAILGQSPVLAGIGWTDAAGNRLYSSNFRDPPPLNIADQEAFK